jgi:hypothetical protein
MLSQRAITKTKERDREMRRKLNNSRIYSANVIQRQEGNVNTTKEQRILITLCGPRQRTIYTMDTVQAGSIKGLAAFSIRA